MKKALYIPFQLGGVWMVGVRGYTGPKPPTQWAEQKTGSAALSAQACSILTVEHPSLLDALKTIPGF
jgi:hypothetical protein